MTQEPSLLLLRFDDPELERRYRESHARRSVLPVRVMALVLSVLSVVVAVFVLTGEAPRQVGIGAVEEPWFVMRSIVSVTAIVILLAYVGHPRVLPKQQAFIAGLLGVLVLADIPSTARFPLPYGLATTLLQVMGAYVLLRLRLRFAVLVGGGTSLAYLVTVAVTQVDGHPELEAAFRVNGGALVMTNLILAAACHQIERLDRLTFLGRHRTERRSRELEQALHELAAAQGRLLESERQAALGRLAAGLLHELNNPIAVVRSSTQTLRGALGRRLEEALAPSNRERRAALALLEAQASGAERLAEVAQSLERFVDLDRDGDRVVDLREGIRDALRLLGARLEGVRVEDALPDEPIRVRCDPARMNFAFFAVLENAARALRGTGTLRLDAHRVGDRWLITFADDGPGVPAEVRPRLFEPSFARRGGRIRMRVGLPTARRAAEACGGGLEHCAGAGPGATFRFELPMAPSPDIEEPARPSERPSPRRQPSGMSESPRKSEAEAGPASPPPQSSWLARRSQSTSA